MSRVPRPRPVFCCLRVLACSLLAAACSADRHAQQDDPAAAVEPAPPTHEVRTGVPLLMDIPVLGVLFSRRTTVR